MYLKLDSKRLVNTDYIVSIGVGQINDPETKQPSKEYHVIAQLISGQMMSLFMYDTEVSAQSKLDLILKDHNLHKTVIEGRTTVVSV